VKNTASDLTLARRRADVGGGITSPGRSCAAEFRLFADGQAAAARRPGAPQTGNAALRLGARQRRRPRLLAATDLAPTPLACIATRPRWRHEDSWVTEQHRRRRLSSSADLGYLVERSLEDGGGSAR
jgi:hypothetical protein